MTPSPWQASQRPPLTLKEKRPGRVAARLRFRQSGEPVADGGEGAGVGGGIGARRPADRRLVDVDHLVDELEALDPLVPAGMLARAVQPAGERPVERLDDQRRLAAAGDAGDAGEAAEGNVDGRRPSGCSRAAPTMRSAAPAPFRLRPARVAIRRSAGEILAGQAVRIGHHLFRRAAGDDAAAVDAGARPHVDQVVGRLGSPPRRARRRSPCCRGPQALQGGRAAGRCRAGAGRSTARRARKGRRSGLSRSARRGGCAGFRRRTAFPRCATG